MKMEQETGKATELEEAEPEEPVLEESETIIEEKSDSFISNLDCDFVSGPSPIYPKWTNLDVIIEQIRHLQHHLGYLNRVLLKCKLEPVEWEMYEA